MWSIGVNVHGSWDRRPEAYIVFSRRLLLFIRLPASYLFSLLLFLIVAFQLFFCVPLLTYYYWHTIC
jgi:hypothetical protein